MEHPNSWASKRSSDRLQFFTSEIKRKFPDHAEEQVNAAIERALEQMNPSHDRNRLRREVIQILTNNPPSSG